MEILFCLHFYFYSLPAYTFGVLPDMNLEQNGVVGTITFLNKSTIVLSAGSVGPGW